MKKTTLLFSVVLALLFLVGTVSAIEIDNVTSTETSDLIVDNEKLSIDNSQLSELDSSLKIESDESLSNSNANEVLKSTNESTKTTNITKVNTALKTYNPRYAQSGTQIKIGLQDNNGTNLENKSITITLNGKTYKGTTNANGIVYINVPTLKKGTYTMTAKFNGDSQYIKSTVSKKIIVLSSISAKNMNMVYNDGSSYTAKFLKNNGNLANTNVKITLNGKKYTVKTDSKGKASLKVNLAPGTYKINLYNPYSKETVTKTVTVKKASVILSGSNEYLLPKTKTPYSVVLKDNNKKPIKNAKIYFTYNNKQVTASTDKNGEAKITISALAKGTYNIKYQYKGNSKYNVKSFTKKLYVKDSTTKFTASNLKMQYNEGSKFSVKVATTSGKVLANKTVKFTLNGKTTTSTTDNKGVAKLSVGNLKPDKYTVKYTYSTAGKNDYNSQSKTITISQQTATITANDLVMKYNDGSSYQITLKNKTGSPIKNIVIKFTLNGKSSNIKTDENGVATLNVTENVGYYAVSSEIYNNAYYTSSKVTKHILVNGTKFIASNMVIPSTGTQTFSVKVVDGQSKAIKTTIKFTLDNNVQSVQTDENGIAKLTLTGLAKGDHTVTYTDGTTTGSSKISVVDKVTLKEIIAASQTVKKQIENNNELPETVKIGSVTYSTAEYVYLASQAIINLMKNSKADINVKHVDNPKSPKAASNLGNLYDYLSVAKSVVNTANSKEIMPDSVSSKVGTIGYNGLVYATARVVAFYGDYSIMPNYVTIKTYDATSGSSSLNSKNTITNLKSYLAASTNCQVGNSKIKSMVDSLTSGLTTDLAKAKAIYNYVRDSISYSFYYDTKYGAVGTLNAKTGNCVDQSHLLIAMYRTAGLAARYVHGTCVFSSGNTYGHVWTQVLIGNTWTVGDPTSPRNSFGKVVNWNNNNYNLKGYYASIAF